MQKNHLSFQINQFIYTFEMFLRINSKLKNMRQKLVSIIEINLISFLTFENLYFLVIKSDKTIKSNN